MSSFAFLLLCIQACLLQTAYSQCISGANARSHSALPLGACGSYSGSIGSYGSSSASSGGTVNSGQGVVKATGDLPVSALTTVLGSASTEGVVSFSGGVPASGQVAISGRCGCSCQ